MNKSVSLAAVGATLAGAVLAQIGASSSVYVLDIDPGRYAGPAGQRLAVRLGDEPRHVTLGQDEICVQLQASEDSQVINARVRALRPEPHDPASVRVVAPDISPGTFRSTPWGMLLRVVADKDAASGDIKPLGTADAPVCVL